ncbi:signal peptide peptidase SppA [Aliifodinibius salicampi]|uniref:Signal peptide peptidase SppA n=1 Tax=Fodinibius salicampi TaxID=1920655 RepID=A0ABT3PXW0_9BACT|nr:signal peptide peptidase SppA [Fodinibius salicampi]MCW9712703.1 signal peptide peptidase SppA [Fodinibius salicampi]
MNFFKTIIATMIGLFLAMGLFTIILFITVSSSSQEPEPYVQDNTILKIDLRGALPQRTTTSPLDELMGSNNNKASLETLKENLKKAQSHDNIKGILLQIDYVSESWANLEEAHRLISTFRDSSDKFIYANTNDIGYNEKGYFLATAADSVFAPPETFFEFDGFYSEVTFYDGLFEKLGIEAEVTRHGKYKGAVEPYYRREMSEENEYQMNQLLNEVNNTFITAVSPKSGRSAEELNSILNDQPRLTTQFAYDEQLIDSLLYADQLDKHIEKRIGLEEDESFKTISNSRYARVTPSSAGLSTTSSSHKIAVLHASGPIMPNADSNSPFLDQQLITADFFDEQLQKIRDDEDVKALVIHVDSPGGSGSTSDAIWRNIKTLKDEMPVIVSMGGVAASGGYYIAMAADTIVAQPTTITGSIGVFGTKLNTREFFNDKIGITFDDVKTHEHADWLSPNRGFTEAEQKAFQQFIDGFYEVFIQKAADSRNMDVERMDELAQGRVWTGADAKENGLIDLLGGLDTAIQTAAEKAELTEYSLQKYPSEKSFYELLMSSTAAKVKNWLGDSWISTLGGKQLQEQLPLLKKQQALTLFPYHIEIQ